MSLDIIIIPGKLFTYETIQKHSDNLLVSRNDREVHPNGN